MPSTRSPAIVPFLQPPLLTHGIQQDNRRDKKKAKAAPKEKPAAGMSNQAKAILAHKQRIAEEEARLKKLQEEEEERIRLEEERLAAEAKAIEEEKERKRKARADKVANQKAAGTYMTKAEKERAKKATARLESLKASGIQIPEKSTEGTKSIAMYGKKKPKVEAAAVEAVEESSDSEEEEEVAEPVKEAAPVMDDWDAEGDDWESALTVQ